MAIMVDPAKLLALVELRWPMCGPVKPSGRNFEARPSPALPDTAILSHNNNVTEMWKPRKAGHSAVVYVICHQLEQP